MRLRYRGKGVGAALLEEVVSAARAKGGVVEGVEFAADHASESPISFSNVPRMLGEDDRRS